jgi:hypothetical protein
MVKMKNPQSDPFLDRINIIMADSAGNQTRQGFRSAVVSEIQIYSRLIDEQPTASKLFFKICDLLLGCESTNITDNSFKVLMANLVHEHCYHKVPSDDEIKDLTGLSASELDQAREALKGRECLFAVFRNGPISKSDKKAQRNKNPFQSEEVELE